ncbi:hypothetical protein H6F46_18195 [Limnothrix sp. FACHB-1083]|uniref:element excision factor XisH family protein n=1 Tax=unclassified Limnothrix TaxID=2632864 RepID=UPI0016809809|nr:hypothetical protein [Limnothrix sp. FACHB-1083]MBD2193728.1 hypothetical protein [Limnothrix sp. FACHB-1088]
MSRRDGLHFSLRSTLEADGWIITDDPLVLVLERTLIKLTYWFMSHFRRLFCNGSRRKVGLC